MITALIFIAGTTATTFYEYTLFCVDSEKKKDRH